MAVKKPLKNFHLQLFLHKQTDGEALASYIGNGEQWQQYRTIMLPGFDGSQCVDLTGFWHEAFSLQISHYEGDVIGRETIVKWFDTKQLTERFTAVADLIYE